MNNSTLVTEVVANQGTTCAFKGGNDTLGVARRSEFGHWYLRLAGGVEHICEDFDAMRDLIRGLVGHACFERRRIEARGRHHGKLAA